MNTIWVFIIITALVVSGIGIDLLYMIAQIGSENAANNN